MTAGPSKPPAATATPGPACAYCTCELGAAVKIQPTTVDGETFCPTCMVWHRGHREPERFSPGMQAVRCGACGWVSLSFGKGAGNRRACGVCGRSGAAPVRHDKAATAAINAVGAKLLAASQAAAPKAS